MDSTFTQELNAAADKQKSHIEKSKEKNNGRISSQKPNFALPRFRKGQLVSIIQESVTTITDSGKHKDDGQQCKKVLYTIQSISNEGGNYFYTLLQTVDSTEIKGAYAEHELTR